MAARGNGEGRAGYTPGTAASSKDRCIASANRTLTLKSSPLVVLFMVPSPPLHNPNAKPARALKGAKKFLASFFLLAAATVASAQQAAPAWPVTLLDKPFHVGDESNKEMRNAKPDGAKFTATFELPANIKPGVASSVVVTIRLGGLLPADEKKFAKQMKKGQLLSRLYINGTEVAVLNKLVHGRDTVANIETLQIRVPGTALRAGGNELEIRPGANTKNIDDFELHQINVGSTAQ
jgi:hypothetical protein